jgi:predicted acylesterase/phospholipase RssA
MILVVSGGGFRAFYGLGILKAIEELKIDNKIKACFGVSGGAILLAWWLSGYSAGQIFEILINLNYLKFLRPNFKIYKSLINISQIEKLFKAYLKPDFEKLTKKLYIGAVDLLEGKYILYSQGLLYKPLIGSMSLPGIFPGVKYD